MFEQFGKNRRVAQKHYWEFIRDGIANRPWDNLKGQIYSGSEEFIERHSADNKELKEIPRAQGEKGDRLLFLAILATVYDELLSNRLATLTGFRRFTATLRSSRHGDFIYISQVLAQEPLGLKQIDEEQWELRYSFYLLGILNQQTKTVISPEGWHRAKLRKP